MMAVGKTHVGRVRTNNEDTFSVDREMGLVLVADGMGGHASGEVASRMAVEIIHETYQRSLRSKDEPLLGKHDPHVSMAANHLLSSIRLANRAIYELGEKQPQYRGMGTTLVGLLMQEDHLLQFHVGDSRIYRFRDGAIEQVTEDHSLVVQQRKLGLLTEEEARVSKAKNVITRAIGVLKDVEVDLCPQPWVERDTYLLCSDGLSDHVSVQEMQETLVNGTDELGACGEALIALALDKGGHDNVTVVLVRLGRMRQKGLRGTFERFLGYRPGS
jgi:protein phosphatase